MRIEAPISWVLSMYLLNLLPPLATSSDAVMVTLTQKEYKDRFIVVANTWLEIGPHPVWKVEEWMEGKTSWVNGGRKEAFLGGSREGIL